VTLCENAAGALYIVNIMCVNGQRKVLDLPTVQCTSLTERKLELCFKPTMPY